MMRADESSPASLPRTGGWILAFRLLVGCLQGVAAWQLSHHAAWRRSHTGLFEALLLSTAFLPTILLAGIGRMRGLSLLVWLAVAGVLVAAWAIYAAGRGSRDPGFDDVLLGLLSGGAVYVAHHLIEPADEARSFRPGYPRIVDGAWRHVFQLGLSLAFVGVFWGVLQLGAALFGIIGIQAVGRTLRQTWLVLPLLGTAFAAAVHLTDVRPGMIAGVRSIALTLLAWLLPVGAALLGCFVLSLPATGLAPLWATGRSASILLAAAALLVVLVNAAYQDGRERDSLPAVIRWSGRLAGCLLVPLTGLAVWSLALRVGQYGLTPDRVFAAAVAVILALYGLGYAAAALSPGRWMRPLETTNIAAAVAIIALIALMLSPVLDPARLTVENQIARLESGRVETRTIDLGLLSQSGARYGHAALERLASSSDAALATRARVALGGSAPPRQPGPAFAGATMRSPGQTLPQDFRDRPWTRDQAGGAECLVDDTPCDLFVIDLDGDGEAEVIVKAGGLPQLFKRSAAGTWTLRGYWEDAGCTDAERALAAGAIRPLKPEVPDLEAGGLRLHFHGRGNCRPTDPR